MSLAEIVRSRPAEPATSDFGAALLQGLGKAAKSIPSRFFYDARGSRLFEEITRQPEYYPTRTEIGILEEQRDHLHDLTRGRVVVELGSGSSRKSELLFDPDHLPAAYVPLDISPAALKDASVRLNRRFPRLRIHPLVADLNEPIELPPDLAHLPRICFFPGSTIGNYSPAGAKEVLRRIARLCRGGELIIGVDVPKRKAILESAYDDRAGITAQFNLNLLVRANRELGTRFELDRWQHRATYDTAGKRIDMWLVSLVRQHVDLLGRRFTFEAGERVHTEVSQKYAPAAFTRLAAFAGWRSSTVWSDPGNLFSVHLLSR